MLVSTLPSSTHDLWNVTDFTLTRLVSDFSFFLESLSSVSMSFDPAWSGPGGHTNIQEQRERWEKKVQLTTVELLQTERCYCQQLELVTTVGIPAPTRRRKKLFKDL